MSTPSAPSREAAYDLDILALGAHPDDVEIYAGGALAAAVRDGLRVGVASLTRGEMGTRGSVETRAAEFAASMAILEPARWTSLDLPDGAVADVPEQRLAVARLFRQWRPRLVLVHALGDRHPDHDGARALAKSAAFVAYMGKAPLDEPRHQIAGLRYYLGYQLPEPNPSYVVDVSETFETKLAMLRCYGTQFSGSASKSGSDADGPPTLIASADYWEQLELRARRYGRMIGVRYGEPFLMDGPVAARGVV
jgi:bacillithiol biosynthesis deacetylase BshB1